MLAGLLLSRVRETFEQEDWGGLRQSHFRVLTTVPPGGLNVTELAALLGMTKQGCGKFVTGLVASGHLAESRDPTDRRQRLLRRTAAGECTVRAVTARNRRLEEDWSAEVGAERYATFRRVLEELALGADAQSTER